MLPRAISGNIEVIRVLHVDDDPNQFEFIKFFLNQVDPVLKVTCVSTPDEVMTELDTGNYDCVVTDFQMPVMNGIDLSRKIRVKHSIPIILYTGQGSEEVAEAAFMVGVNDYLRKEMDPSHYQVLAKRIRGVVEKTQVEHLYETIVEQTRDALLIFIDGQMVFGNRSALQLLGVDSIEVLTGSNPFSKYQKNENILEPGFHEFTIEKRKDQKIIEVSSSPIVYKGKNAVICFARDITEKRNLELNNKVSQERFRKLVDLVPDGIISMTPLGYISFANDTFLKLTGFSRGEVVNKHLTEIGTIPKRDLFKHVQTFASIITGNIPPPMEFHWKKKDGSPGLGEAHISLIDVNNRKEILLIARDITNQKKREIEFNTLLKTTSDGIIETDLKGYIISINDAASKYTDLDKENTIGKHFNTVFNIEQGDLSEIFRSARKKKTKTQKNTKIKIVDPENNRLWINASSNVIEINNEEYCVQLILKERIDTIQPNKIENLLNDITSQTTTKIL